jgi:hypothetical protein
VAKAGDVVAVEFMDHCENSEKPLRCVVYGRLVAVQKHAYVIDSWEPMDVEREPGNNTTTYTLVKETVKRMTVLVSKRSRRKG